MRSWTEGKQSARILGIISLELAVFPHCIMVLRHRCPTLHLFQSFQEHSTACSHLLGKSQWQGLPKGVFLLA